MSPRHGEVWIVDMGLVAKTRPAVVLIADQFDASPSRVRIAAAAWKCRPAHLAGEILKAAVVRREK